MRFITEFKVPEAFHGDPAYWPKWADRFIHNNQEQLRYGMGEMLQESFGFQNPVNSDTLHHRLEIEAFPMDKWVEFKSYLLSEINKPEPNVWYIDRMIKELESFGNPVTTSESK
jgi:hypothetical protein